MRPVKRSGYIPAVARALIESFPEWAETATVTEEESVTVTSGIRVSKPCLLIRIPSPVAPQDPIRNLDIEIVEDETTIFFDQAHRHLSWSIELTFDEHKANVVDYVRNIVTDAYVIVYFQNSAADVRGVEVVYKPDQAALDEPPPEELIKHVRSWTGRFDADITSDNDDGVSGPFYI